MLCEIEFASLGIKFKGLGANNIIICKDYTVQKRLAYEFNILFRCTDDVDDSIAFTTNPSDEIIEFKNKIQFLSTAIYQDKNTKQTFVISVEATSILSADAKEDVWFAYEDCGNPGKLCLFPLVELEGAADAWQDEGPFAIYARFVNINSGYYDGEYLRNPTKSEVVAINEMAQLAKDKIKRCLHASGVSA